MLNRYVMLASMSLLAGSAAFSGCSQEGPPAEEETAGSDSPSAGDDAADDTSDGADDVDDESGDDAVSDSGGARNDGGSKDAANSGSKGDAGVAPGGDGGVTATEPPKDGEKFGEWTYYEVAGAVCRDGSPAGYYIRPGSSKNLMIFLNGGGVCYDDFFCGINPPNVNSSLPGETLLAASLDIISGALLPVRQQPTDNGIFKKDAQNPVGDWSMVYVPYCTGDVYGGTKANASVPKAALLEPQQFVGYRNIGLFLEHFGKPYKGAADKVLLTGSSAGGFGTLLNFDRTQDFFGDDSTVYAVTDSGIPFRDEFLEPCLQKEWRELWGLNDALPKDCKGCFDPTGGGLATGLGEYIFRDKYKKRKVIGGGVSSKQDEVIKLFFSAGLNECTTSPVLDVVPAAIGLGSYPVDRYPAGLKDFLDNVAGREKVASYGLEGSLHQHLFRDRFFEVNGVGTSIAEWLGKILDDEPTHVGGL